MAISRIGERRVCIHTDKEAGESRLSSSDGEDFDSVLLPVSRNLHGVACLPDACREPFYRLPSARTLQKEHPRPWTAPRKRPQTQSCDAKEDCSRIKVRAPPRYTLQEHFPSAYKEPWPEHGQAVRPATAGREHELPTWWISDAHPSEQFAVTRVRPLVQRAGKGTDRERPRWASNAHVLTDAFNRRAENKRHKKMVVLHMPAFLKPRPASGAPKTEWEDPQVPPAVDNAVKGPNFGQVANLAGVKGKRWVNYGYHNVNYHGKGVYVPQLDQDRKGVVCEWWFGGAA